MPKASSIRPGLRRDLPLLLGRQVLAHPARERVGLVVAHMADRRGRIDRPQARERQRMRDAVDLAPVAGRLPAFRLHRRPAVGEPQRGRRVAAVGDEIEPLRIGDERARDPHRPQIDLMRRALRCRSSSPRRRSRWCADPPALATKPGADFFGAGGRPAGVIGRRDRIQRKRMQDVGEQQLLMLLLVIETDLEDAQHLGELRIASASSMSRTTASSTWAR